MMFAPHLPVLTGLSLDKTDWLLIGIIVLCVLVLSLLQIFGAKTPRGGRPEKPAPGSSGGRADLTSAREDTREIPDLKKEEDAPSK